MHRWIQRSSWFRLSALCQPVATWPSSPWLVTCPAPLCPTVPHCALTVPSLYPAAHCCFLGGFVPRNVANGAKLTRHVLTLRIGSWLICQFMGFKEFFKKILDYKATFSVFPSTAYPLNYTFFCINNC